MAQDSTSGCASTDAIALARRAFEGFRDALRSGDGDLYARTVAEDIRFHVAFPIRGWQGEQRGRDRIRELIRIEYDELGLRAELVETALFGSGSMATIEFDVVARVNGAEYRNHNCLIVETKGGEVVRLREFVGEMDPDALRPIVNAQPVTEK
jgi:ketosteroid isomerase-like protein